MLRRASLLYLLGGCLFLAILLNSFAAPASALSIPLTTSASSSIFSLSQGPVPQGWSPVSYGDVTLAVPASWPVYNLALHPEQCVLFNRNAVYLGEQSSNARCPAHAFGKVEALQISPLGSETTAARLATAAATVAGVPARLDPFSSINHTFMVVLSQAGVVIKLSYGRTDSLARTILATLRVSTGTSLSPTQSGSQVPSVTAFSNNEPSGVFSGKGFDTCTAPSTGSMSAWLASPYRAVGIYIGGANRACGDGNLSSSWVNTVTNSGWSLIPLYVGLQSPCVNQAGNATIDPPLAASEGTQAADDAVSRAQGFGLGTGTLIVFDMEAYNNSDTSCSQTTMTFLSAWTQELHARNYLSGVYSSLSSGITDLLHFMGSIQEPDSIDFAHWDNVATTSDAGIPSTAWANHQRIKQYQGDHNETYGGVTINIDNDQLDTVLKGGRAHNDFNGDGRSDLMGMYNLGTQSDGSNATGAYEWLGTSSGVSYKGQIWQASGFTWSAAQFVAGDFNGDGHTDVMAMYNLGTQSDGSNAIGAYEWLGTSSGLSYKGQIWQASGFTWSAAQFVAGDFNGDGRADVMAMYNLGTQSDGSNATGAYEWLGTSSGLSYKGQIWQASGFTWSAARWVSGDFNGDGYADVMAMYNLGGSTTGAYEWLGTSSGLNYKGQIWQASGFTWSAARWVSGDFNGDGRADVMAMYNLGTQSDGSNATGAYEWLGTSSGLSYKGQIWQASGFTWSAAQFVAGDFNGDGLDDVMAMYNLGSSTTGAYEWLGTSSGVSYKGQIWQASGFTWSACVWVP